MIAIMKPICASKHVTLLEFDGLGLVRFCYLQKIMIQDIYMVWYSLNVNFKVEYF